MNMKTRQDAYLHASRRRASSLSGVLPYKIFWCGVILLALFSVLYTYFIAATVVHAVEREDSESEIRGLSERISSLEVDIASHESALGDESLASQGYIELENIAHISRSPALTLRDR